MKYGPILKLSIQSLNIIADYILNELLLNVSKVTLMIPKTFLVGRIGTMAASLSQSTYFFKIGLFIIIILYFM